MTQSALKTFEVGTLDMTGFEDVVEKTRVEYIKEKGTYDLKITGYTMSAIEDSAGKPWGNLALDLEDINGAGAVKAFIRVPISTPIYTNKSGGSSTAVTSIFLGFVESLTGVRPESSGLEEAVRGLPDTLKDATIRGIVGHDGDYIKYLGKNEDSGELSFTINLRNGDPMLDASGEALSFSDSDSATAYYKNAKGFNPKRGMGLIRFIKAGAK